MEEHNTADALRLLSDESNHSPLALDSHQTATSDRLPSMQRTRGPWGDREACRGGPEPRGDVSHPSRGLKEGASTRPLRSLVMCIQGKRDARDRRKVQISNIGCWESWRRRQSLNRKRFWAQIGEALSGLLPWQHTLHVIEGRFGVGVKAYFVFLRYLVYLNLLHCALISNFILGPTAIYGRGNGSEPLRFGGNDSVLDFFLGSGFLDRSPVFIGFYSRGSLNMPCLNTPLLYLAGILAIFLLSLVAVVRRTVVGYKHTWMLGKHNSVSMSHKIFCGWDFNIQDPSSARLQHGFIRNDLKLFLEEQSFALREAQRTLGKRARLYLLRLILNLLVLALLGGACYLIYFSTRASESGSERRGVVTLILQYLPPIAIAFVNLFLPHLFRKISSFEDYSSTTQVNVLLMRSIYLRLSSLSIFLYFIRNGDQRHQCWENRIGREMYKLCIFSFLTSLCNDLLLSQLRKLVVERYPTSLPARWLGKQHFLVPFNVLHLVYVQTVSWVGVYYCPLLPFIGTVTLMATFYIKKFSVLRCCVMEQRMFRASSSSVLFHFMLLLGLTVAAISLGFNLHQREATPDSNGSSCGPFGGGGEAVFYVTGVCVASLPGPVQTALRYLASEAFAIPLILTEVVILTSYVSRRQANQKAIERLKDMLVMSSSDKRFLVEQHAMILRRQRETRSRPAIEEDVTPSLWEDPPSTHTSRLTSLS